MQPQVQSLIDGLFGRLKQAQARDSKRDQQADQLIHQHLAEQPDAPYYMTQTLQIRQAILARLNERVKELEASQSAPSGGSVLSGLFGSASHPSPRFTPPYATAITSRTSSFMESALQTATGVASGVTLADMIGELFHSNRPAEVIDTIELATTLNQVHSEQIRLSSAELPPDAGGCFLDDDIEDGGRDDRDDNNGRYS